MQDDENKQTPGDFQIKGIGKYLPLYLSMDSEEYDKHLKAFLDDQNREESKTKPHREDHTAHPDWDPIIDAHFNKVSKGVLRPIPQTSWPDDYSLSANVKKIFETALLVAKKDLAVIILGESGCGKDHLARFIHKNSARKDKPFFNLNCAAISKELTESELFGHEQGAFTGAQNRKPGLLELANQGTLLLNEIGEMSLVVQAKLLTFLDTGRFLRVGGTKNVSVDAHIIAATNRNLRQSLKDKSFRLDLYYRLHQAEIELPSLNDRRSDIPYLTARFLHKLDPQVMILRSALHELISHKWDGNVRQLENVLTTALAFAGSTPIDSSHLNLQVPMDAHETHENAKTSKVRKSNRRKMPSSEKIKSELDREEGHQRNAAASLGFSESYLSKWVKDHDYKYEPSE